LAWFIMRVFTTSKGVDTSAETRPDANAPNTLACNPSSVPSDFSSTCFTAS